MRRFQQPPGQLEMLLVVMKVMVVKNESLAGTEEERRTNIFKDK
jgi:hypothetical protein